MTRRAACNSYFEAHSVTDALSPAGRPRTYGCFYSVTLTHLAEGVEDDMTRTAKGHCLPIKHWLWEQSVQ